MDGSPLKTAVKLIEILQCSFIDVAVTVSILFKCKWRRKAVKVHRV